MMKWDIGWNGDGDGDRDGGWDTYRMSSTRHGLTRIGTWSLTFVWYYFFNIHTPRFGSDASMSVRSNEYWVWTRKEELELELREMRSDRMRPDPTGSDQA